MYQRERCVNQGDILRCLRDVFGWKQTSTDMNMNSIQKNLKELGINDAWPADISNLINGKKAYFQYLLQGNWHGNQAIAKMNEKGEPYETVEEHFYAVFLEGCIDSQNIFGQWSAVKAFLTKEFKGYTLTFPPYRMHCGEKDPVQIEPREDKVEFKKFLLDMLRCGLNNTEGVKRVESENIEFNHSQTMDSESLLTRIKQLSAEEQLVLQNLLLLPQDGIPYDLSITLKIGSQETLEVFKQRGWVVIGANQNKTIRLQPDIRQMLLEEWKPNFELCITFLTEVQYFAKKQWADACHQYDSILSKLLLEIISNTVSTKCRNAQVFSFLMDSLQFLEFSGYYLQASDVLSQAITVKSELDPEHWDTAVWQNLKDHHNQLCAMLRNQPKKINSESFVMNQNDGWKENLSKMDQLVRESLKKNPNLDLQKLNQIERDLKLLLALKLECAEEIDTETLEKMIKKLLSEPGNSSDAWFDIRILLKDFESFYEFMYHKDHGKNYLQLSVFFASLVLMIDEQESIHWNAKWELTVLDYESLGFAYLTEFNDLSKAKKYFEKAEWCCKEHNLTYHPVYAKVLFRFCEWYFHCGKYQDALISIEKAISILNQTVGQDELLLNACLKMRDIIKARLK